MKAICAYCHKEFEAKNKKGKFCSNSHRVMSFRKSNKKIDIAQNVESLSLESAIALKNQIEAQISILYANDGNVSKQENKPVVGLKVDFNDKKEASSKHLLWKQGDPTPNTMSFLMKYDCMNYEELAEINNKSK